MPGRILIVDNNVMNLKLIEAKLEQEYYETLTATSGAEALEIARSQSPDLIMLDIMMPEMDGYEVCRRLKADAATALIPVVMVTALSDPKDRIEGLAAGADDFISKPIEDYPLLARLRSLIRLKLLIDMWQVREETSTKLGINDLDINFNQENNQNGKILVFINDMGEARSLERILHEDKHYVELAESFDDYLQKVLKKPWELLIISMEKGGDKEVLRLTSQIRSHSNTILRSIPILMMTDVVNQGKLIAKAFDIGISDYCSANPEPMEFLSRVRIQLRRFRYQDRLRNNYENSVAMASTDPLTGVYNRRFLDSHLTKMLQRSVEENKPITIAFCDIDFFKIINDTYGHDAGDRVLIEFSQRLQRNLRNFDLLARWGGEEFVIIMPDLDEERAKSVGERLRMKIAAEPFLANSAKPIPVTVSIGVTRSIGKSDTIMDLVKRADDAMYEAKKSGRNRVVFN